MSSNGLAVGAPGMPDADRVWFRETPYSVFEFSGSAQVVRPSHTAALRERESRNCNALCGCNKTLFGPFLHKPVHPDYSDFTPAVIGRRVHSIACDGRA
jgi:hypothetical protein